MIGGGDVIFLLVWVGCGVLAYGAMSATRSHDRRYLGGDLYWLDYVVAMVMAWFGPVGLIAVAVVSDFFAYGFCWPMPGQLRKGDRNGRYREAAAQAGGGAAQGADPRAGAGGQAGAGTHTSVARAGSGARAGGVTYVNDMGYHWVRYFSPPFPPLVETCAPEVGEIIAYRCWRYRGVFVQSVTLPHVWPPGEPMVASYPSGDWETHLAGIHAWKDKRAMLTYAAASGGTLVMGRVALWGTVYEHERGYRAEYARIVAFDDIMADILMPDIPGLKEMLAALRERYGLTDAD